MEPECDTYTSYEGPELSIDIHDGFLCAAEATDLLAKILKEAPFKKPALTKKGEPIRRRNKLIFGDEDFPEYKIVYRGETIKTPVLPWSRLPILKEVRDKIATYTGQPYNTCVIQLYPTGSVGIKPHRDKEADPGTIIASLSLGETRDMRFEHGSEVVNIPLEAGALCLIRPPTNNFWLHSIPLDETKKVRASLVFRNFHTE